MFRRMSLFFLIMLAGCQLPFSSPTSSNVHLVIDAGSSGTRFCPYDVDDQCRHLDVSQDCLSIKSSGGLADLPEPEILRIMKDGFQNLQGMNIEKVVVLGTGGFRRLPATKQAQQMELVRSAVTAQFAQSEARILTGEEEAQLAYIAMVAYRDGKRDHVILETGGATVQLAGQDLSPMSIPAGLNAMRNLSGPPAACRENTKPSRDRFHNCADGLRKVFRSQSWYASFFQNRTLSNVYALGSSWKSIFTVAKATKIDQKELELQGIRICSSSQQKIVEAGVPEKFASASCYLHAYQFVLISELNLQELHAGEGSWPPGAAISNLFAGCPAGLPGN